MTLEELQKIFLELQILADDYGDHITEEEFEFIADVIDAVTERGTESLSADTLQKAIRLRNKYANFNFEENFDGES